ncbi:MAG TPA: SPASM domain-containing protein [Firmicutes bacterium]|nr:SPASM domain-containing protein [Bacillota bacterium]
MHFTLHVTNHCNMACAYCYVDRANLQTMTFATACRAVDLACELTPRGNSAGIIFFGGEPLLCKELICETIAYANWKEKRAGCYFHYKMTTNGLLLDEDFLEYARRNNLFIALSHDGIKAAHDKYRRDTKGKGTYETLAEKAQLLLAARPYAPVLLTVNPDTACYYAESVEYLYQLGFRYLICSLNYAAAWREDDLETLAGQYRKLADFYYRLTLAEEKFYFSPFEVKINSHINHKTYCRERCELGLKQLSVAPDGRLYPCVQFVGDDNYTLGDVFAGVNEARREHLYRQNDKEKETCRDCAVRKRCNHYCGCLNKQATGSIDLVSPVLCAHERLLLPLADKLAERLFQKRSAMFLQKHYNDYFPLVSLVEDLQKSHI